MEMEDILQYLQANSGERVSYAVLPEHELWNACISQAVRGAQRGLPEDYSWCFSEEHGAGSFKWICDMLDIDYLALRQQITAWKYASHFSASECVYQTHLRDT